MKKNARIIGPMLLLAAAIGCHTQTEQQPSRAAVSHQSESAVISTRDLMLLYVGDHNPGTGWEQKSSFTDPERRVIGQYERRVTVKVDVSKSEFPRYGLKSFSLSLTQLGTLPPGEIYIGPIDSTAIGTGVTEAMWPTSAGLIRMLRVEPAPTVLQWTER